MDPVKLEQSKRTWSISKYRLLYENEWIHYWALQSLSTGQRSKHGAEVSGVPTLCAVGVCPCGGQSRPTQSWRKSARPQFRNTCHVLVSAVTVASRDSQGSKMLKPEKPERPEGVQFQDEHEKTHQKQAGSRLPPNISGPFPTLWKVNVKETLEALSLLKSCPMGVWNSGSEILGRKALWPLTPLSSSSVFYMWQKSRLEVP